MRFTAAGLAAAAGGRLVGPDVDVDGVATDTRTLASGQLFVPLVDRARRPPVHRRGRGGRGPGLPHRRADGGRGDGHRGGRHRHAPSWPSGRAARDRLGDRVVGITGSVGKTTVKELVAGALADHLPHLRRARSPSTTRSASPSPWPTPRSRPRPRWSRWGPGGPATSARLCAVARPTIGVVTRVGLAHTELFGSLDAGGPGQGRAGRGPPAGSGTAVLNADDERVAAMAGRTAARVRPLRPLDRRPRCGPSGVVFDALARAAFVLSPPGLGRGRPGVHGEHQVTNALAAAGAALAAGVAVAAVAEGLAAVGPPALADERPAALGRGGPGERRLQRQPDLDPGGPRVAGGDGGVPPHRRARGDGRAGRGVGGPVTGRWPSWPARWASSSSPTAPPPTASRPSTARAELVARLGPWRPGDVVLVKGSRAAGMETLVDDLLGAPGG